MDGGQHACNQLEQARDGHLDPWLRPSSSTSQPLLRSRLFSSAIPFSTMHQGAQSSSADAACTMLLHPLPGNMSHVDQIHSKKLAPLPEDATGGLLTALIPFATTSLQTHHATAVQLISPAFRTCILGTTGSTTRTCTGTRGFLTVARGSSTSAPDASNHVQHWTESAVVDAL